MKNPFSAYTLEFFRLWCRVDSLSAYLWRGRTTMSGRNYLYFHYVENMVYFCMELSSFVHSQKHLNSLPLTPGEWIYVRQVKKICKKKNNIIGKHIF